MARNRKVELSTIIGKGSKVTGNLFVDGGVRVDGEIEGKIESNGFVTIGISGVAKADIHADECLISGKVVGDVHVTDGLEMEETASLTGDITAKVIKIHTGAIFNGSSRMGEKPSVPKKIIINKKEAED
ncbi:MAG TPA: polymer-forming cytoskeletal protein [Candidatus Cloacimonadota bacterium]|nr:polymer-forming cytoskeletal protein [Candidatus Cloacimonadota bacterium]